MKNILLLIAIAMLSLSGASALEPLKVAIMNTSSSAVNVQVILNDYTGGTATTKYTGAIQSLTPNGSGIIIAQVANNVGTDWDDITGAEVSSYYILDVLVGGNLYAQYRLDQLILSQSQSNIYNNNGNLAPSTSGGNDLGEDNNRWGELYVQGNTIHIGPDGGMAGADELAFSYNDATNTATMTVAGVTALTAVNDNINIPQQATIDGLAIGQGGGNINTNTAIGNGALSINTTGSYNTANGQGALANNTTGYYNTANGATALYSNTTGSNNTANGQSALANNTTGGGNTANGQGALANNTTGYYNTANGQGALQSSSTGNNNTANGQSALYYNTTGSYNTANGATALYSNTTGSNNTANGNYALASNTTGSYNTANGATALYSNTTGSYNTANGATALYSNTTGSYNTANGQGALESSSTGNNNTAIGRLAGYNLATGSDNTFIGKEAGYNVSQKVDAQNSMAIGADTYTTANNQVVIGNSAITETQLRGKLQNNVTTAANTTALAGAVTSVINYTGSGAVTSGDLPTATDGTFLFVLCTNGGFNFLGQTVSSGEVVTCLRIGSTWYRVK